MSARLLLCAGTILIAAPVVVRASSQLATVGGVSGLGSADLSGSAIDGEGVSIGVITCQASIVEDTLNSPPVRDCALAQIRTWQFPAIPSGTTSFKTPFVFTPPSQ